MQEDRLNVPGKGVDNFLYAAVDMICHDDVMTVNIIRLKIDGKICIK